jgi:hypothetical protein
MAMVDKWLFASPEPSDRVIQRDVIITEIAPVLGYSGQITDHLCGAKPILAAYVRHGASGINRWPKRSSRRYGRDVIRSAAVIGGGYDIDDDLIHGYGGHPPAAD